MTQPTPAERARRLGHLAATAAVALVAALVLARLLTGEMHWILWGDRDLTRLIALPVDWPTSGAELSYGQGARLPGGAWHVLQAPFFALRLDPTDIWLGWSLLDVAAAAGLAYGVARAAGRPAAAATLIAILGWTPAREALNRLWNPTPIPPLLALSWGLLWLALSGRRWAWPLWAWVLVIAGQAHFTALVALGWSLLALVVLRPRETLRHLPWIVAVTVLAYLPYVADEAALGWPNTRALLQQRPVSVASTSGLVWEGADLRASLEMVLPAWRRGEGGTLLAVVQGLSVALAGLGLLGSRHLPAPARDTLRVATVALIGALVAPALDSEVAPETRYALASLPGFALLVGVGVGTLTAGARAWLAWPLLGLLAAPMISELLDLRRPYPLGAYTWQGRYAAIEAARPHVGGSWEGVAGRTVFAQRSDRAWVWGEPDPMDWLLRLEGATFPGSLDGPCALVLAGTPPEPPMDDAAVARLLGLEAHGVRVQEIVPVVPQVTLVVYDPHGQRCRTTSTNRYIDTPVEAAMRPHFGSLPRDGVLELPVAEGRRVITALDLPPPRDSERLLLGVDLRVERGTVTATLHSNQLRGWSYNGGWFVAGLLDRPRIVLEAEGRPSMTLVWEEGPVGLNGVVTPLDVSASVPPGTWRVTLHTAHIHHEGPRQPGLDLSGTREAVVRPLLPDLVVP